MAAGLTALSGAGDILNVRGVHSSHGSCPGDTNGWHRTDVWSITKTGASGNPIIIQANGWTAVGAGTQEAVYTEAVKTLTSGDWTVCVWDGSACDCDAANLNVQIGAGGQAACEETWWHTKTSDGSNRTYWGTKPDGSITPRRATLAEMTAQYDANDIEAPNPTILIRWGSSLPADPSVNFANNGNQFRFVSSSWITLRGFTLRRGQRAAVTADEASSNIVIQDNKFFYFNDSGGGSARPVEVRSATSVSILDNEFAYISSEPIHVTTHSDGTDDGTVSATIQRNWVHDIGDRATLGNGTGGTPNCTTFTSDAPTAGYSTVGDFTGTVVEDNLFDGCSESGVGGTVGQAILFESHCDNVVVRNNVIRNVSSCFRWSPDNGGASNHTNANQVYNNLCIAPNFASQTGFLMKSSGGQVQNNLIFNNTVVNPGASSLESDNNAAITGNVFRNNIFSTTGAVKMVNFIATDASNLLEYNLIRTTANPAITWLGVNRACADIDLAGTGNIEGCPDPAFANVGSSDYHIQTSSPAKDAGTATGMPAGRTTDIANSIAALHGLPDYNDADAIQGGVWDIGVDEFVSTATRPPLIISEMSK